MKTKMPCPQCHKSAIKHSKILLTGGKESQRYRCEACKITFNPSIHSFFKRTPADQKKFNEAIFLLVNTNASIRKIAKHLKVRPNTVISWRNKVKNNTDLYRNYLITNKFLSDLDSAMLIVAFRKKFIEP